MSTYMSINLRCHPLWLLRLCDTRALKQLRFFQNLWFKCTLLIIMLREGFQESKWKWMDDRWIFPLSIDSPPLNGHNFQTFFCPTFFHLQLNPTYMKRILHLVSVKNITFKSTYNSFKIDIHQQLRPLTANYLAMFKVISTTIYT